MKWTNVKDKHFAQITEDGNSYFWESTYEKPFLVAVPTNKGWDIEKVILEDETGLRIYADGETHHYGYEMTDVTHWCEIVEPEQN